MEKVVRVYFNTFFDVPWDSDDFSNDEEMIRYTEDNIGDFVSSNDIMLNLNVEENKSKIVNTITSEHLKQ